LPRPLDIYRSINPYSEAQFKTLKYRPDFPERFGSLADARAFCQNFFGWYNTEHYHSGIGYHHPIDVHYGQFGAVRAGRAQVLADAYTRNPERFVRKHPGTTRPTRHRLDQQARRDQHATGAAG
jgi:putative transposase